MLDRIYIKNVALIDELELDFTEGLNILSGETGAGKSIVIDCILLLIGNRFDSTLLRYGAQYGIVEGVFSGIEDSHFDECGIERDEKAIVTRRFTSEGKNDIRINGRSVTLNMLKRFTTPLIDIYGQNEFQSLFEPKEQLQMLDLYSKTDLGAYKFELKELLKKYKDCAKSMEELGDDAQRERNMDLLRYQIDEIESAEIKSDEEEELVERRKFLLSAEKISASLSSAVSYLNQNENLYSSIKQISQISGLSEKYNTLYERLQSVAVEIEDISDSLEFEEENTIFEEGEIENIEERLKKIRDLKRKYGPYEEMIEFLRQAKKRYEFLEQGAEYFLKLKQQIEAIGKDMLDCARKISSIRKRCASKLELEVINQLASLGMPSSRFEIRFPETEPQLQDITENGYDEIEFYLSTNPGYPLRPLAKIISGGEASRFMLAIKAIEGNVEAVNTMIFDEIDSGISGRTGQIVAQKLADIAKNHQILCITHLAPIAAMADRHFFIKKEISENKTYTLIELLNEQDSVLEIARLLGAKDISSQSEQSAKQLKEWGDKYKSH